jgi:hypothetical protein
VLIAALLLSCVLVALWLLHRRRGAVRYRAAHNALVAKYTYHGLDIELQEAVYNRAIHELRTVGVVDPAARLDALDEAQRYGYYAAAMAALYISPAISGEKWWPIRDPAGALRGASAQLVSARQRLASTYGLQLELEPLTGERTA